MSAEFPEPEMATQSGQTLFIWIDKANDRRFSPTSQKLRVFLNGNLAYEWDVSTGRETREEAKSKRIYFSSTPVGDFGITYMNKNHVSQTWEAPMPNAIFFKGGAAIHGVGPALYSNLGKRASGGCVRLQLEHSELLWDLVRRVGKSNVRIQVVDSLAGFKVPRLPKAKSANAL